MATSLIIIFSTVILGIAFILVVAHVLQRKLVERRFSTVPIQSYEAPRYPSPNDELLRQIEMIEPSQDFQIEYKPCLVTLLDGRRLDCVYVLPEQPYFTYWGVWPEDDRGKYSIRIQDVSKIEESPSRLPPQIANELYQTGESGMGYYRFTLIFNDNSQQEYITGNAVDFVPLPAGKTKTDISKVLPGVGSDKNYSEGLKYFWCLHS